MVYLDSENSILYFSASQFKIAYYLPFVCSSRYVQRVNLHSNKYARPHSGDSHVLDKVVTKSEDPWYH
jgi:hypothetical protein